MLAAILDPLHRPAEQTRRQRDHDLLRIDQVFASEAAPDLRGDDTQLLVIDAEQPNKREAHLVRALSRSPQRRALFQRIVARQRPASLDRMRAAAVLLERERKGVPGLR